MKHKIIDLNTWKRRNHFEFYKDFHDPCFNMCLEVDVTQIYDFAKKNKYSVFLSLLYISSKTSNSVEAFKTRINEHNKPVIYNVIHPSATVMKEDETFNFCDFNHQDSFKDFIRSATALRKKAKNSPALVNIDNQPNQIFYSVIPWLRFTSFKHAQANVFQDVPKIVFGKIVKSNDKKLMPISIELHHAIADGIDVHRYVENFKREVNLLVKDS